MRLINNRLYLTIADCVECGMSENYLRKAKSTGAKCWDFIDDPADKRKVLVGYDELGKNWRRMVDERWPNVYDQVAREPILAMVVNDHRAVEFYKAYRFDNGEKYFPLANTDKYTGGTVNKYVRAASWLNMLRDLDKQVVKKVLNLQLTEFYIQVGELISQERERGKRPGYTGADVLPGEFPGTYQRLMQRVEEYKTGGYEVLINSRIGNNNGSKLGKIALPAPVEVVKIEENGLVLVPKVQNKRGAFDPELRSKQTAIIRYCAALGNNLNAGQVQKMVNRNFKLMGWETLSVRSFSKFINENMDVLTPGRKGKKAYMNSVAMQNKRKRPPLPLLYVTLDGWTVELSYKEYDKKASKWDYKRVVVVVVLDPMNNYPLGYAIGDRETAELIREACRNAIVHTAELFGQPYQPMQVQSDRYQIKHLTPFYQAMAGKYYTPAEVGNSKAKAIEPYFAYLNKDYCQAECRNWSGYNVDASKKNQVNREWLDMVKSQFPDKKEVEQQIHDIIGRERKKKGAEYMAKWQALPEQDRIPVGVMDYLKMFGVALGERTNSIEGQGIVKQVAGKQYVYDSFEPAFRKNLNINWQLTGDPENMGRVLAESPDGKLRFVLEEKRQVAMDIYSRTPEDVAYMQRVKEYNKDRMDEITKLYAGDAEVVREVLRQAKEDNLLVSEEDGKAMQLMFTVNGQQKERIQDAKRLGQAQVKGRKLLEKQVAQEIKEADDDWEEKRRMFMRD